METAEINKLRGLADTQIDCANKYAEARKMAGNAEADLKILLTSKLKELRINKKNLGVEMAILMLCEENELAKDLYKEQIKHEAIYKGLERILDAQSAKLIFEQSLMKRMHTGDRYGV